MSVKSALEPTQFIFKPSEVSRSVDQAEASRRIGRDSYRSVRSPGSEAGASGHLVPKARDSGDSLDFQLSRRKSVDSAVRSSR